MLHMLRWHRFTLLPLDINLYVNATMWVPEEEWHLLLDVLRCGNRIKLLPGDDNVLNVAVERCRSESRCCTTRTQNKSTFSNMVLTSLLLVAHSYSAFISVVQSTFCDTFPLVLVLYNLLRPNALGWNQCNKKIGKFPLSGFRDISGMIRHTRMLWAAVRHAF